ncbi:MAG: Ribose transport system permease protein RbsC [Planctomycetota bacterium]|jgi:ribose transport system permease protein
MNGKITGIFSVLLALCVILAAATADPWYQLLQSQFLNLDNIMNLLSRLALYGILGIGVAFVIISSGIDLSIGSLVCLCGVLLAILLKVDYQPERPLLVERIEAAAQTITVSGEVEGLSAGTVIRYTGGVGSGLVLTVESVEGNRIRVRELLRRDERDGRIVAAVAVNSAGADGLSVQLPLVQSAAVGDQLQLFLPDGAVTTQKITTVSSDGASTSLTLVRDPGSKYRSGAFAVLLKRSQRMSIPVAVLLVLSIAGCLGLIHGLLITRLHLQPFVVTLCGLLIYRGVSRWLTNDNPAGFGELQQVLGPIASGRVGLYYSGEDMKFGIPIPFFLLLLTAGVAAVFLNRTIWGRYLLALGRNEEAARFSGINTARITVLAYVLCALLAALGGMLFAIEFSSISPSSFGNSFELYAIAAAVLGGCSLRGGEGSIVGVVIGTAVMQVLNNLIVLLKIPQSLEATIIGAVILLGVLGDELMRRAAARRRLRG